MSNTCHGCKGNGWVSPNGKDAMICPVCEGSGVYARKEQPVLVGLQVMCDTGELDAEPGKLDTKVLNGITDNVLKEIQNKMQNQARIRASV